MNSTFADLSLIKCKLISTSLFRVRLLSYNACIMYDEVAVNNRIAVSTEIEIQ